MNYSIRWMPAMRIVAPFVLACCVLFTLPSAVFAAQEKVVSFESDITITKENRATVRETIVYDFADAEERHGIYRNIPYTDPDNGDIHPIAVQSITDEKGNAYQYETSTESNQIVWKIGDPDKTIEGQHTYILTYTFEAPVRFFTDRNTAEFAWGVTGNGWSVPIENASTTIRLETDSADTAELGEMECSFGVVPELETTCSEAVMQGGKLIAFNALRVLEAGEGMQVRMVLPPTIIQKPGSIVLEVTPKPGTVYFNGSPIGSFETEVLIVGAGTSSLDVRRFTYQGVERSVTVQSDESQRIVMSLLKPWYWWFLQYNVPLILAAMYTLWFMRQWYLKGKEPKTSKVIVTEFDVPDRLSPLSVGALMDQHITAREISAQIVYLATQGVLTIRQESDTGIFGQQKKPKYTLVKNNDLPAIGQTFNNGFVVTAADQTLLKALFGDGAAVGTEATLESLKKTFYTHITTIHDEVYQDLMKSGYLTASPKKRRASYAVMAVLVIGAGIGGLVVFDIAWLWAVLAASGVAGLIFSRSMGQRTQYGAETFRKLQGYQRYLEVAEKDRITFFNDPVKYQQLFEAVLPFAMVLGVENAWASHFEGLYQADPAWYQSNTAFVPIHFVSDMQSFSSQVQASTQAPSSSSGGGGGSFGGGGGGSW